MDEVGTTAGDLVMRLEASGRSRLDRHGRAARGAQAALDPERVGLVDAAAERDHGELHRSGVYVTSRLSLAPGTAVEGASLAPDGRGGNAPAGTRGPAC